MNENINLVEILKDAPKGTKLWSPVCGECEFLEIVNDEDISHPIICRTNLNSGDFGRESFSADGKFSTLYKNAECVLFPSKVNRDWSAFKVPKKHKHFEPFQKVLVGLMMNGRKFWKRDVYMYYREDIKGHCTIFESMVPDNLIIPYDVKKDGKSVK